MSEPEGTPPETTPEPEGTGGTPPAPSKQSGGKTAQEWEASYKGLQGAYQKLKESTDKSIAELTLKLQEANQRFEETDQGVKSKDTQMSVLQQQIVNLTKQVETLSSEKETVQAQASRGKLVMTEFPELAPWEAQGLLPQAPTEEELRGALSKFRDTLSGQVGAGVKRTMSGATPPGTGKTSPSTSPTPGGDVESEEYVWKMMVDAAGRNEVEFKKWQAKYDEIQAAKS